MSQTPLLEQIRIYSEALVDELPVPQIRRTVPSPAARRPTGWLVAAGAAVVVLLLGLVPLMLFSGDDDPAVEPATTVSTSPPTTTVTSSTAPQATAPPPTASPQPDVPFVTPTAPPPPLLATTPLEASHIGGSDAGDVYEIATSVGLLRATAGCSSSSDLFPLCDAVGIVPQDTTYRRLSSVVAAPWGGYVAIERAHDVEGTLEGHSILTSVDGISWELAAQPPALFYEGLSVAGHTLWLSADDGGTGSPALWQSANGTDWVEASVGDGTSGSPGRGHIGPVTSNGATLIAPGTDWNAARTPLVDWWRVAGIDPEGNLGVEAIWDAGSATIALRTYPDRIEFDEGPPFESVGRYRLAIAAADGPLVQVIDTSTETVVYVESIPQWVAEEVQAYLPLWSDGQNLEYLGYQATAHFVAVSHDRERFTIATPPWSGSALSVPNVQIRVDEGQFVATVERRVQNHDSTVVSVDAWVSDNGLAWSRAGAAVLGPPTATPHQTLWHGPTQRFLGLTGRTLFESSDGMTWTAVGQFLIQRDNEIHAVSGLGFLVFDWNDAVGEVASLYLSADGQTWTAVDLGSLFDESTPCRALVSRGHLRPAGRPSPELWLYAVTGTSVNPGVTCSIQISQEPISP
jgi:hypothetical protein